MSFATVGTLAPLAPGIALGVSSLVHLGYHFGGVAQMDGAAKMQAMVIANLKSDDLLNAGSRLNRTEIAQQFQRYDRIVEPHARDAAREALRSTLGGVFDLALVDKLWARPVGIRMGTAKTLLQGKLAKTLRAVQKARAGKIGRPIAIELSEKLKQLFADAANLAIAHRIISDATADDPAATPLAVGERQAAHDAATRTLAAVADEDVRKLFTGGLSEQIAAMEKSKRSTMLETFRYKVTYAGSSTIGDAIGLGLSTPTAWKTVEPILLEIPAQPIFEKLAGIAGVVPGISSPEVSTNRQIFASRADIQEIITLSMSPQLRSKTAAACIDIGLPRLALHHVVAPDDVNLDALLAFDAIPARVQLLAPEQCPDGRAIEVDFDNTTHYYRQSDQPADQTGIAALRTSFARRWKVETKKARVFVNQVFTSVAALFVKGTGAWHMRQSRPARREMQHRLIPQARQALMGYRDAGPSSPPRGRSARPPPASRRFANAAGPSVGMPVRRPLQPVAVVRAVASSPPLPNSDAYSAPTNTLTVETVPVASAGSITLPKVDAGLAGWGDAVLRAAKVARSRADPPTAHPRR